MKIAVISDIHGNVFALDAVLEDIRTRGVDLVVNLGDIFYGPIAPRATFDLLMEHAIVSIQGNQDRQLCEAEEEDIHKGDTMAFVLKELEGQPMEWLRSLPGEQVMDEGIHLCHGAPGDDMAYLLEDISDGIPRVRNRFDLLELLKGVDSPVILCGHSHISRTVMPAGSCLIVNPGSVGLPAYTDDLPVVHAMENHSPLASYSLLIQTARGWQVEHYKIPYDVEAAVAAAMNRKRLDWGPYLSNGWAF